MQILDLDAQLKFCEYSRRNHYIFEEISASFIHFNAIVDVEIERWITIQNQSHDTPPISYVEDTIELYNLKCISNEDDKTAMPFSPEEMEYIKEIIIDEVGVRLSEL